MRIPVFVSGPTVLSPTQAGSRKVVTDLLERCRMDPRALGRSDYPKDAPLKEVLIIAKHCHGGVILGFEQLQVTAGTWKRGTKEQRKVEAAGPIPIPTPWNQLEAGVLFGLRLPLLIFREPGVSGGIFDVGATDVFVHTMPPARPTSRKRDELEQVFLKWSAAVQRHYDEF